MPKYSDWLKIDLHIHTDYSRKTKENDYKGTFSVEELHNKLKENEVQIFSLTDHNIINVPAYREYYSKYNKEDDPLLLLGVEMDIERLNITYHSLLIFNITEITKVEAMNKNLEKYYREKKQGEKERKITIDDIVDLFGDDDFFFIPHAHGHKSIVTTYKDCIEEAQKMIILMQSKALEKVPAKAIQIYNEGFDSLKSEAFADREDIAYICFSDNHNISNYPCIHMGNEKERLHEFYYVKGHRNYETIRISFIDPLSRIKSSSEYSKVKNRDEYIIDLHLTGNDILLDNELNFSPNLNVIIGGRSSGKSLLMNILGKKIDKVHNTEDKYNKIDFTKLKIRSNKDSDKKDKTAIQSEIIYINQGDIVRYFESNELSELARNSDKITEYNDAREIISQKKRILNELLVKFNEKYSSLYEMQIMQKYVMHISDIKLILGKAHIIKDLNKLTIRKLEENEDKLRSMVEALKILNEKLIVLKEQKIIEVKEKDKEVVENIIDYIKRFMLELDKKIYSNQLQKVFLNEILKFIKHQKLQTGKEETMKVNAVNKKAEFINRLEINLKTLSEMKIQCKEIEEFHYTQKEIIEISQDIRLILEVKETIDLKGQIIRSDGDGA